MMKHFLRFSLLATLICVVSACHEEVKDVPLNNRLIAISDKFYDVKALSPEKAIVVGYGGKILMTTDGGKSWQLKPSGTELALYNVKFVDAQNGWIAGQDGCILRTKDGGETWQKQESGITSPIFSLAFVDKDHGWAVSELATYLRTTNGGESWESGRIEASLAGVAEEETLAMTDPTLHDIYFIDEKTGWMVGEFGKIYHSTDGGMSWTEQQGSLLGQSGFDDALNFPAWFGVRFANAEKGFAVGLEGKIVETTDGGKSWKFIAEDVSAFSTDPLYALSLHDGNGWISGGAGRVLQLQGDAWKPASLGLPVVPWLRSVDFLDENSGWIVGGYGTIIHTTDGGKTWRMSVG
jgi:photosystem II stability/assembly factor-like uncharacterized protein